MRPTSRLRRRSVGAAVRASRGTGGDRPYPRLVIAATTSGAGKTSVTAGLLAAMAARGTRVAPFKCGPDFLDPQVLRAAARAPSASNLDRWLTSDATLLASFRRHGRPGLREVNLIEGVMGVLDTASWGTSTADVATQLDAPIVLVVDASRAAESVALQVRGAREMLPEGLLAGVIVNRAGRGWHSDTVRREIEGKTGVPVLGVLPWSADVDLPEQHLGLLTPRTRPGLDWASKFRALRAWAAEGVDLDRLQEIAQRAEPLVAADPRTIETGPVPRARVAVAMDPAFCFLYPENMEALTDQGARIESFSPVRGDSLPPSADAIYLPGGYPESHARELSRNDGLRRELRDWVRVGRPLFAECGGMMYLLGKLVDVRGRAHPMAGAFPGSTEMQARLAGFGYGEAHLRRSSLLGERGQRVRGHVYHHSHRRSPAGTSWAWQYEPRSGAPPYSDGLCRGRAVAGYLHLRLDEYPHIVDALLAGSP
jgi:cobyrinic acid a,c-diamide synthase